MTFIRPSWAVGAVPWCDWRAFSGSGRLRSGGTHPGAGEAAQPEPDHRQNMLGLAKERFDRLVLGAGDPIGLGLHQSAGIVARRLVGVARDPAPRHVGTTLILGMRFQWAVIAITISGDITIGVIGMEPACGLQDLTARTDIEIALLVVGVFETLVALWRVKRGDREMPSWADFDFFDFKGWHGVIAVQ